MTAAQVTEIIKEESEIKGYTPFGSDDSLSQIEQNRYLNAKRPAKSLRILNINSQANEATLKTIYGAPQISSYTNSKPILIATWQTCKQNHQDAGLIHIFQVR